MAKGVIKDLEIRTFSNFGKHYVTHSGINFSVQIPEKDLELTPRGLVKKYFPNWKEHV